jgi:hypothetical protein
LELGILFTFVDQANYSTHIQLRMWTYMMTSIILRCIAPSIEGREARAIMTGSLNELLGSCKDIYSVHSTT